MPEVKMDFIPDDMSDEESINIDEFNEDKDKTQEEIEEAKEANIAPEVEEETPQKIPKAKSKRDEMNINEIFNMPEAIPPSEGANVKLTKKGKPRKKRPPMTEEHKAKLAKAREKAMEARKQKAQEKKEAKALEKEEKELLKKQKVKRVKKLKEEVENNEEGAEIDPPKKEQSFSKKDLEEAQLEAIMKYETIRKQRKKEKQEKQKKDAEEEAIRQQLRRAVAPPQEYNPFSGCY
tara:strand:+ start:1012 stop:1716 length:705 start_codon:yes stop_codon:yes gene_type:complete